MKLFIASWYVAGVDMGAMAFKDKDSADTWNRDCLAEALNIETENAVLVNGDGDDCTHEDDCDCEDFRDMTDEEIWEAINDQAEEMINHNVETQEVEF